MVLEMRGVKAQHGTALQCSDQLRTPPIFTYAHSIYVTILFQKKDARRLSCSYRCEHSGCGQYQCSALFLGAWALALLSICTHMHMIVEGARNLLLTHTFLPAYAATLCICRLSLIRTSSCQTAPVVFTCCRERLSR